MMKKIYHMILVLFLAVPLAGQVEFMEIASFQDMETARQQAANEKLMLFVDVYATWCGPCKVMDREVYTDPAVALYMNSNFVNVRLDGESDYGRRYAADQGLQGYPSMFVFAPNGELVRSIVGFTAADELVSSLSSSVDNYGSMRAYRIKYEEETLSSDEFARYVALVRETGNDSEAERLAAEYTGRIMGPELTDSDIRVVAYYMDLGNFWWKTFSADPERLRRVLGDEYMVALEKIYNNTLVKAVEEDNLALISGLANDLAPMIDLEETTSFDLRTLPFLQYYYYTNQVDELIRYVDQRFASDRIEDHRWLYGAASQIIDMDQQYRTEALMEKGVTWFEACYTLEEQFDYYFYHGMALFFLQRQDEAKGSFEKAGTLALNDEQRDMVEQVLGFFREN